MSAADNNGLRWDLEMGSDAIKSSMRIFVDFNSAVDNLHYRLSCQGTIWDILGYNISLKAGMKLTFFNNDDFDEEIEIDGETVIGDGCYLAKINWDTIRKKRLIMQPKKRIISIPFFKDAVLDSVVHNIDEWIFSFNKLTLLKNKSPWRLLKNDDVIVSMPANFLTLQNNIATKIKYFKKSMINCKVLMAKLRKATGDLTIYFNNKLKLEIMLFSNDRWSFTDLAENEVVCQGGYNLQYLPKT